MDFATDLWLIIKYLFLGLFQGFTEPIPISSSGHLVILRDLFGIQVNGLSFEILVNSGSLIAVLIIYRQDIIRMIQNGLRFMTTKEETARADFNFILYLIIGTIPAGVVGVLFGDWIENTFSYAKLVGITLIITGIALWIIRNIQGFKSEGDLTIKDALIVGGAQAIALIPGISRSGATIVAAMLLGMRKELALRFSFLLYIPVSLGILVLGIEEIVADEAFSTLFIPYTIAFAAAILATYYSLRWFINIMAQGNLKYFTFYCFIVGTLALIFL